WKIEPALTLSEINPLP
ncbi:hypothetical protein SUGI_0553220, partial [Cryptomeria japonica]